MGEHKSGERDPASKPKRQSRISKKRIGYRFGKKKYERKHRKKEENGYRKISGGHSMGNGTKEIGGRIIFPLHRTFWTTGNYRRNFLSSFRGGEGFQRAPSCFPGGSLPLRERRL